MKSAVNVDGHHHQEVSKHDKDAYSKPKSHHQPADCIPLRGQVLPTFIVKEGNAFIVVTLSIHLESYISERKKKQNQIIYSQ